MQAENSHASGAGVPSLRVVLIEDDKVARKLMESLQLKHGGFELAGSWGAVEEAVVALSKLRPDVVLVDRELPGISWEDCLKALSSMLPCATLLVLRSHDDPSRVFASLRSGASGSLLKGSSAEEITSAIKAAYAGGSPLSPAVAGWVIQAFRNGPAPAEPVIPLPSLAPREQQILEALSRGRAPKEVAAELFISDETVRDYLKSIYQKLHVRSKTEAVLKYLDAGNRPGV